MKKESPTEAMLPPEISLKKESPTEAMLPPEISLKMKSPTEEMLPPEISLIKEFSIGDIPSPATPEKKEPSTEEMPSPEIPLTQEPLPGETQREESPREETASPERLQPPTEETLRQETLAPETPLTKKLPHEETSRKETVPLELPVKKESPTEKNLSPETPLKKGFSAEEMLPQEIPLAVELPAEGTRREETVPAQTLLKKKHPTQKILREETLSQKAPLTSIEETRRDETLAPEILVKKEPPTLESLREELLPPETPVTNEPPTEQTVQAEILPPGTYSDIPRKETLPAERPLKKGPSSEETLPPEISVIKEPPAAVTLTAEMPPPGTPTKKECPTEETPREETSIDKTPPEEKKEVKSQISTVTPKPLVTSTLHEREAQVEGSTRQTDIEETSPEQSIKNGTSDRVIETRAEKRPGQEQVTPPQRSEPITSEEESNERLNEPSQENVHEKAKALVDIHDKLVLEIKDVEDMLHARESAPQEGKKLFHLGTASEMDHQEAVLASPSSEKRQEPPPSPNKELKLPGVAPEEVPDKERLVEQPQRHKGSDKVDDGGNLLPPQRRSEAEVQKLDASSLAIEVTRERRDVLARLVNVHTPSYIRSVQVNLTHHYYTVHCTFAPQHDSGWMNTIIYLQFQIHTSDMCICS